MKVSKQMANDLAKTLVSHRRPAIEKAEKQLRELADKIFKKTIPANVLAFYEKSPEYIRKTGGFYVSGNGFVYSMIHLSKSLPSKSEYPTIIPSDKDCEALKVLLERVDELKKNRDDLMKRSERAILDLSSTKRVATEFPELSDYLKRLDSGKFLPVPNLEELKKELKSK